MITLKDFPTLKGVVITQPNGDLGDGPQRTFGMYHVAKVALREAGAAEIENYRAARDILQDSKGWLIRDPNKWNDPHDIPADQFDPSLICAKLYGDQARVDLLFSELWPLGFYPNRNPPNLGSISTLKRCDAKSSDFWITQWDKVLLQAAKIDCARAIKNQGIDGNWLDVDNAVTRLVFCQMVRPTKYSQQALEHYVANYPRPMKDYRGDLPPLLAAIAWKHRAPDNNPAFSELWAPIIEGWYSGWNIKELT